MIPRNELRGFRGLFRRLEDAKARGSAVAQSVMKERTLRIAERSQYYVPVDTSALKNSMRIVVGGREYKADSDNIPLANNYQITYNEFYAVYVHELLHLNHDWPTQAKYLETAAREVAMEPIDPKSFQIQVGEGYEAF